jgi:hypothetical protein
MDAVTSINRPEVGLGVRIARSLWSARSLLPLSNHRPPYDSASKLDALQTLRAAVQGAGEAARSGPANGPPVPEPMRPGVFTPL